jgi:hypothetical protein
VEGKGKKQKEHTECRKKVLFHAEKFDNLSVAENLEKSEFSRPNWPIFFPLKIAEINLVFYRPNWPSFPGCKWILLFHTLCCAFGIAFEGKVFLLGMKVLV